MQKLHRDDYNVDQWSQICKKFGKPTTSTHIWVDENYDYFSDDSDFEDYMYNFEMSDNVFDPDDDDIDDDDDVKWVE